MPSGRGMAVLFAGLAMWLVARLIGSPGMEVVALGLAALPAIAALFVRYGRQRIAIHRRLSDIRVAPGTRVTVYIDIENRSATATSFLMVEDRLPSVLGRPARLVVSGIPGHGTQRVTYTVLPQTRGRYQLGPLSVDVSDPFALVRQRLEFDRARGPDRHPRDRGPDGDAGRGVRRERRYVEDAEPLPDRRGVLHDAPVPRGRRPPPDPLAQRRAHR